MPKTSLLLLIWRGIKQILITYSKLILKIPLRNMSSLGSIYYGVCNDNGRTPD